MVKWCRHANELLVAQYHVCITPVSSAGSMDVVPCTESTVQGNDFELIPTVKWKVDIP